MSQFPYVVGVIGEESFLYHDDAKQATDAAWRLSKIFRAVTFTVGTAGRFFFEFRDGSLVVARTWEQFYLGMRLETYNALQVAIVGYPGALELMRAQGSKGFENVAEYFGLKL